MDGGVEQLFAPALGVLTIPGVLGDVGDQAGIEYALPIAGRIKAAIEVEVGTSAVQPDILGPLFATVVGPPPWSTRRSTCFSLARFRTLATNACHRDPSSAHFAKTLSTGV